MQKKKAILGLGLLTLFAAAALAGDLGQVGANDFRISAMDGGSSQGISGQSDVVFNPQLQQFLVVWSGVASPGSASEIHGQRLDTGGNLVGAISFQISMLSQGNSNFGSFSPTVAYSPARQEYLVVWYGSDFFEPTDGSEVYGQRLAANGSSIGSNFQISETGDGSSSSNAFNPAVAFNPSDQEYLVVWYADDGEDGMVDDEFEIFGQRLSAEGGEIGSDFRISAIGGSGDAAAAAFEPAVAFDPVNGWYLVVWSGDPGSGAFAEDEFEIFGQLLDSAAQEIGANDFRISDLGGIGDADFDAGFPDVALHGVTREWWVVWGGDDNVGGQVDGEFEIFGQRLTVAGVEIGENDFRISTQGGIGNVQFGAFFPAIAYDPYSEGLFVTWAGRTPMSGPEIFGQSLRDDATPKGGARRLSDMGPESVATYSAGSPALARGGADGQLLVIWSGTDDENGQTIRDDEIFAQRLAYPFFCDDFESGDFGAWSAVMP